MLDRLTIMSFKAYERQDVALQPFTVIVGPNGAGKTTVLQAIEFVGAMVSSTLPEHLRAHGWEYKDLPRLRSDTAQFGFAAEIDLEGSKYVWELRFQKRRRPGVALERVTRRDDDTILLARDGRTMSRLDESTGETQTVKQTLTASWLAAVDPDEDAGQYPGLVLLAGWARGVQPYLALDPLQLRGASPRTGEGIGTGGANLAGFLRDLRLRRPDAVQRVVERVRRYYEPLEDVSVRSASGGEFRLEVRERWGTDAADFNARQVSDGLLRLLAVSAMYELPEPPTVLMFDEIENGVHPSLLGGLVQLLAELTAGGRTQVLATSHSPVAVNVVQDPEQILMATRGVSGNAALTALADAPGYEELRSVFGPGEAWFNAGERALLTGATPAGA